MTDLDERTTVGRWVADRPERAALLGRLGIDFCCGARMPLDQACWVAGLDVHDVLARLDSPDEGENEADPGCGHLGRTWASIGELIDHIVSEHHDLLRREVPWLIDLAERVAAAHGTRHPELRGVWNTLREFWSELEVQLREEEETLFPRLRQLAGAVGRRGARPDAPDGPIRSLESRHFEAAATLGRIRALTDTYATPSDACALHRALVERLAALDADLRIHFHEENNLLLPRALGLTGPEPSLGTAPDRSPPGRTT